jgi:hypothetical protein
VLEISVRESGRFLEPNNERQSGFRREKMKKKEKNMDFKIEGDKD